MPRKKKSTRKSATQSKAGFVRSHPSLSAKEIVAKAKASGIHLTDTYVYNVRSSDNARKGKKSKSAAPLNAASRNGSRGAGRASPEELLRAVAAELGLGRAIAVLQAEHDRVSRLLRG